MFKVKIIMLVDFDYFYAQCEEKRNPYIKDKPIVVCVYSGRSSYSGVVSTSNYIARKYGVKSGIPITVAKKRLVNTDAIFLPLDLDYYKKVSNDLMKILSEYADIFEQVSIDEAYMDITRKVKSDFLKAENLAKFIKSKIKNEKKFICSIGVGPNKIVAKIAASFKKPNSITIVKPDEKEKFLAALPIDSIPGIGKKNSEKMAGLGITKISELAKFDVQKIVEVFGKKLGIYFYNSARGIDDSPVKEKSIIESISRIVTLKKDSMNVENILKAAFHLCEKVQFMIVRKNILFKTVSIILITEDMRTYSRSKTFEKPENSMDILIETVEELIKKFFSKEKIFLRRIGVKVTNLSEKENEQKNLMEFLK
jgi:DNA polymerase IV (DinB-like DNA polymerase)